MSLHHKSSSNYPSTIKLAAQNPRPASTITAASIRELFFCGLSSALRARRASNKPPTTKKNPNNTKEFFEKSNFILLLFSLNRVRTGFNATTHRSDRASDERHQWRASLSFSGCPRRWSAQPEHETISICLDRVAVSNRNPRLSTPQQRASAGKSLHTSLPDGNRSLPLSRGKHRRKVHTLTEPSRLLRVPPSFHPGRLKGYAPRRFAERAVACPS